MRQLLLIVLLLLPGLLWAQPNTKIGSLLTVKRSEAVKQPLKTIFRPSKSSSNTMIFQDKASWDGLTKDTTWTAIISPGAPLCWDSAGIMVKIDPSEKQAKTKGYQNAVKIGPSFIEYDSLGNIRYEKGGQVLGIKPAFTGVKMEFEAQATQMKATYYIDKDIILSWKLIDPYQMAARKIAAFTALDADNKTVALIEERTDTSLSVRIKDSKGVTWPVAIDPTIQDTALNTRSTVNMYATNATYNTARDAAVAAGLELFSAASPVIGPQAGFYVHRVALTFPLSIPLATAIDTAYLYVKQEGIYAEVNVVVSAVTGTFSGDTAAGWFNDFHGWSGSDVHTPAYLASNITFIDASVDTVHQFVFTAAGRDTLLAHKSDSLRIMMLAGKDISRTSPTGTNDVTALEITYTPWLYIVYSSGNPPGASTLADTARAAARLVGEIVSTGGANCTVRGFKLTKGGADTTTISESGSFTAGTYALYTAWLWPDSVYYFRSYATNPNGTSYGDWTSFTAASGGTGGSTLNVDGRTVNTRK